MANYAQRLILLNFPELAEPGDKVWVTIRNPKVVPPDTLVVKGSKLSARAQAAVAADGQDQAVEFDEADRDEAFTTSHVIISRLVAGWHVYDGLAPVTLDDDGREIPSGESHLIPLPATPERVARLPSLIIARILEEVKRATPQIATGNQEATTST